MTFIKLRLSIAQWNALYNLLNQLSIEHSNVPLVSYAIDDICSNIGYSNAHPKKMRTKRLHITKLLLILLLTKDIKLALYDSIYIDAIKTQILKCLNSSTCDTLYFV